MLSGRYPLYRMLVIGFSVGAAMQLLFGVPKSVAGAVEPMVSTAYSVFQLVGALLVLLAIQFMPDTPRAARIERLGLLWIVVSTFIYVGSVVIDSGVFPKASSTYLSISFGCYGLYRIKEITKYLKELKAVQIIVESDWVTEPSTDSRAAGDSRE
ncbi:hypothetical protein PP301_gp041 [Gordonia phage GMA2]|uniref:Uncharacterized protein n=1 Tax=Gordonia phage GMA2 TaxID=1647283 RepID=A0A0K0N6M1_9CAUD|nr:hypothetical protein PP301_gp041 [Gordonia phage GMA2]AKJ72579.1 hypothetical protein GMA2_41 [Gordonia phage GMA2]